jgi:3-oxoacyl-[acyl-carrier protein] reductase
MVLKDKVIIVTGAASGLGRAFSVRCAHEGAKVVSADIADPAETVKLIRNAGGEALGIKVDITEAASVEAMCKAAEERYGGIDGIINNAAISTGLLLKRFHEIEDDEWDRIMKVNAKGTWICCKTVYPYMVKRGGGSIVNISSSSILEGSPFLTHYIASKGAVWAMTRSISRTTGEQRIRCNSITLGFTLTDGAKMMIEKDPVSFQKTIDYANQMRAIHRSEEPEDVVGGAVFLLSDSSAFITGQNLNIDGGSCNY